MSHSNRSEPHGNGPRPRRQARLESVQALEDRKLLTPVVAINAPVATLIPANPQTNDNFGTVVVTQTGSITASAAPLTSVAQLTSANSFGGDIVRIEAGPGGDFGKGVYAISRGAGENADSTSRDPSIAAPINRPGVIYRVDPATGRTSVFFDLNTVINQIVDGGNADNGASPGTGLVNFYDLAFDPEGVFDGRPSLFVSSLSTNDPTKNVIFRIGPDGSFLGIYIRFTAGGSTQNFTRQPSAVLVPPVEQQNFLKGLFVGQANGGSAFNGTGAGNFQALFFDANQFRPGQDLSGAALPSGVTATPLSFGPQVGLTAANTSYASPVYSVFTDFGTPGAGGIDAAPGLSGVQGLGGELLINGGAPVIASFTDPNFVSVDQSAAILTPFRRFQDVAFDQYGYFSYGLAAAATAPTFQGSLFVADLGTGLSVQVTPLAPFPVAPVNVPIQGPGGPISVVIGPNGTVQPVFNNGSTTGGNIGGRIVRITPDGTLTVFANNFHTSGSQDAQSFLDSSLSVTFSADGTTMYVADDDGIWQFKTVTDIANATSGSLIGLNDLRALGSPYDGQDSAVAVIDTGIDSLVPNFRGRVATGFNVLTNGFGNDDLAAAGNGHGTLVAGVIAQFVPQATLNPVNVFTANQAVPTPGGANVANATSPQNVYLGLNFVSRNPFVADPVRPNKLDRTIGANIGFGTTTTYQTETGAFRSFPQVTVAFKNQLSRFRKLGISTVAASGQFGSPQGVTIGGTVVGDVIGMAFPAILNEAISVTGSYPFPYVGGANTSPIDPGTGVIPRPNGPILLFGNPATGTITGGTAATVATGDTLIFKDKLLASSNRSLTTDYTAPELDVPTWARSVAGATVGGTVGGGSAANGFNVFQEGGTSLSSAIVSGSFAMVESALDFWTGIARNNGVTVDGYVNTPVGTHQLNFGAGGIEDLGGYANIDGINSILEWTAVPANDAPNTLETVNPPTLIRGTQYRNFARIDIGNAIAAIEGSIALDYLFKHGAFDTIDANKNGLITAQELQNFTDDSANVGMPEAGALARFLGGTARIPTTGFRNTSAGEQPEQPDVLARRFNFFDYAADGQLNGAISIDQLRILARNLLPAPDSFTVVDRQRASVNRFLLDPAAKRNISDLQQTLPTFAFIPKRQVARFRNISPARFGVGRGQLPGAGGPTFTLFADGQDHAISKAAAKQIAKSVANPAAAAATPPKSVAPAATPANITPTPTSSPVTTNPGATTGNQYLDLLNALAQGNQAAPASSPVTITSQPRTVGTPAAGEATSDSEATVQTAVLPQTETQAVETTTIEVDQAAATAASVQTEAVAAAHAQQIKEAQVLAQAQARARAQAKADDNKFDFWNPWKSIKKLVSN